MLTRLRIHAALALVAGGALAKKGSRYEATLREPGTYPYFCDRHQFMGGVVIVTR